MDKPLESVILLPVPHAEPAVKKWRVKYDRVATLGIPAHITLLFPFKVPSIIDTTVKNKLQTFFLTVCQFSFSLTEIGTFPNVIFLNPSPRKPFIELTKQLAKIFPENPPYEGKFSEIHPHLTIGQLSNKDNFDEILNNVSNDIKPKLPLQARATEARLMVENTDRTWSTQLVFNFRV